MYFNEVIELTVVLMINEEDEKSKVMVTID